MATRTTETTSATEKEYDKFTLVGSTEGNIEILINLFGAGNSNRQVLLEKLQEHISKCIVLVNSGKGKSKWKLASASGVELGFINTLTGNDKPELNAQKYSWALAKNFKLESKKLDSDEL